MVAKPQTRCSGSPGIRARTAESAYVGLGGALGNQGLLLGQSVQVVDEAIDLSVEGDAPKQGPEWFGGLQRIFQTVPDDPMA